MTPALLLTLIGLALVDSVNVSTIWIVIIIALSARRPVATGWAYATGAFITFLAFTIILYFGATLAEDWLSGLTLWFRRVLFAILTVALIALGIRKLKARQRKSYVLPPWVNAWTALPLGLLATLSDIPNAFPMFLAVERLVDVGVTPATAVPVLVGYTFVYALPTLIVLALGLIFKDRLRDRLQQLHNRYVFEESKPSWKIAGLYFIGAAVSFTILIFVIR
ncbi:GAP family protein [Streptomyces sp. NPDC057199]|uniref:GAP family protein n=1 Tax=Streptomyces sp. NPDC057199 TaxID=3346047 RepID=UPI003624C618